MDFQPGLSLGRYRLLEPLGEGGMATVYQAFDSLLERHVAVKMIRQDAFAARDLERVRKRFEREARALALLYHPNIVQVHDFGEHDGTPYLVMEYVPGGTLKARLGQPIPFAEAAEMLLPIARALAFAHQNGVVHRDVKPSNILIARDGQLKLSDFGIARLLATEASQALTSTGVGIGTPEYMSPEQGLGQPVDARADIYALGVVFYELVTGRKPFEADTPMGVVIQHINTPLPRPRQYAPGLPEAVEQVLFAALAKQPDERYPDMAAFAAALEKLSKGEIWVAPGHAEGEAPIPPGWEQSEAPGPAQPPRRAVERLLPRWAWGVGLGASALLVVCILGAVGGLAWLRQVNPPASPTAARQNTAINSLPSANAQSASPTPTRLPSTTPTLTPTTLPSSSPTASPTSSPTTRPTLTGTPTPTHTPTTTPGVGMTQVAPVDGMTLVFVPAGEFLMGSAESDAQALPDEKPQHRVALDAFWIDRSEVTNAMFAQFVQSAGVQTTAEKDGQGVVWNGQAWEFRAGADWRHPSGPDSSINGRADHPVVQVTWYEAANYCRWAGRRLPTEAEWEKAARGISGWRYPWGDGDTKTQQANIAKWVGTTSAVGSYPQGASPFGALDMIGNVWEWTADWYDAALYPADHTKNPTGPADGTLKVMRGGSWYETSLARAGARGKIDPDYHGDTLGFRCALSVKE